MERQADLIEWYLLLYLNGMLHRAVNVVGKMLTHLLILRKRANDVIMTSLGVL